MHHCAHCGSMELQAGFDTLHCLMCGHLTDFNGRQLPKEAVFDGGHNPSALRPT